MVVAVAYFGSRPDELALVATFLAALGILFSFVWAILLHRTNDALALWREAAARLEELQPHRSMCRSRRRSRSVPARRSGWTCSGRTARPDADSLARR